MTAVKLSGRILFLSANPLVVEAQLAGTDFDLSAAGPLRDDISTDDVASRKFNGLTPVSIAVLFLGFSSRSIKKMYRRDRVLALY